MQQSSGPVDYHSLVVCSIVYVANIVVHFNANQLLQIIGFLVTITGLILNCIRLVDWIKIKFFNKKTKE